MSNPIPGENIELADISYVLPPLPLAYMAKADVLLRGMSTAQTQEYADAFADVVFYSLRRNYPDISRETVADNIDLKNFKVILDAFTVVNGLKAKAEPPTGE
jgi:hypothetical protein